VLQVASAAAAAAAARKYKLTDIYQVINYPLEIGVGREMRRICF